MTVVDLRIVCVFGVLCGVLLRAAPASITTYDQRQQGEYNLQVDVDDVALVFLPGGGDFAQRNAQLKMANQMEQILGRRAVSRKKHKKPANCTATKPEEATSSGYGPTTGSTLTSVYPDIQTDGGKPSAAVSQGNAVYPAPVEEVPAAVDGDRTVVGYDPYSVTPDTPNIFDIGLRGGHLAETAAGHETVTVKTMDRPAADTTTISDAGPEGPPRIDRVKPVEVDSGVNLAVTSVQSSDVNTAEKIMDGPSKTVNEFTKIADVANLNLKTGGENDPTAEMVAVNTVQKSTEATTAGSADKSVNTPNANNADTARVSTKTAAVDKPVEMVAMKTMEKPNFAETLKVVKKSSNAAAATKTATVAETDVTATSTDLNKKPTEMVAMKTVEKPLNVGSTDPIGKSEGITTSTKLVEIQENKKTPSDPVETTVVSKSAQKVTELVAVKTVEIPATVTTVKSVNSVKTGSPKTTLSSNGSTVLRKVGDRKPLPLITLEVAPPKVV